MVYMRYFHVTFFTAHRSLDGLSFQFHYGYVAITPRNGDMAVACNVVGRFVVE